MYLHVLLFYVRIVSVHSLHCN